VVIWSAIELVWGVEFLIIGEDLVKATFPASLSIISVATFETLEFGLEQVSRGFAMSIIW
jgi:hypothetical protein